VAKKFPALNRASGQDGSARTGSRRVLAATALMSVAAISVAACSSSSSTTPSSGSSSSTPASSSSSPAAAAYATAPASASQTISETGSSLMAPLWALWGPAYHSAYSQVTLSTASTSSGVGISDAAAGTADIGASDAYLSPADFTKYPTLVNIPLAVAALEVVYNVPGITGNLKLSGTVLAQIYDGKITSWNNSAITALNPGVKLPSTPIVLVHRADSSGSTFLFTSYLNAQDPTDWSDSLIGTTVSWPKQPGEIGATGSGAIITSVKGQTGSIGYVGLSYASKISAAKLGVAQLKNASGNYEMATPATIQAALGSFPSTPSNEAISLINGSASSSYPIINYEYAVVNTSQSSTTLATDLQAFLYWALTSGVTQATSAGFQALPSSVVTLSEAQIAKIKG
jgi:phosphate transport system substrate-binding protein